MEPSSLDWKGSFAYPGMVRIASIADGSCLLHSIVNSFSLPYRLGAVDGKPMDRIAFIRTIRRELAQMLGSKPDANASKTYYDIISRGKLREFAQGMPSYSLASMQEELASSRALDNAYNELISDVFDRDIYILDAQTRDVYVTGDDKDILYKGRNSTVVLIDGGHYELVGLTTPSGIITNFAPEHGFIRAIRSRLQAKIAEGSGIRGPNGDGL